ncbi:MAG: methionine aminopeptidase [Nostocoides sp.]
MSYWFNVSTRTVETDETKSPGADLLGPFQTEAEAANALEIARENTDRWDGEDAEWNARNSVDPGSFSDDV